MNLVSLLLLAATAAHALSLSPAIQHVRSLSHAALHHLRATSHAVTPDAVSRALRAVSGLGGGRRVHPPPTPQTLNVTAIVGADGASALECWQLAAPFTTSTVPGIAGSASVFLGDVANATMVVIPPQFEGGLHGAPVPQYVWFISGEAVISLPNSTETARVPGGEYGLLFAADTAEVSALGHNTSYPSNEQTVAIALPTTNGEMPDHHMLHSGACRPDEMVL